MIQSLLAGCRWGAAGEGEAYAPANIALCKYWGKRDAVLNLPVTDSLSVSLGRLGTHCRIALSGRDDLYFLNGCEQAAGSAFASRLRVFLDHFRGSGRYRYRVDTTNTVATGAGFASSASGFAALVLALDALHGWDCDKSTLSSLARIGSGSACRSLWHGFVRWRAGVAADGSDCHACPLGREWSSLRIGLVSVCTDAKPVSSRAAMSRTVATSSLYRSWPQQVENDMTGLVAAIEGQDFDMLGMYAEQNALAMHATMIAAKPPVLYWKPGSIEEMEQVWKARTEGVPVYFTMDAGPNLKLLFEEQNQSKIQQWFPEMQVANPWRF
jgi:diphosphomevalonate decarboxylase